MISLSLSVYIYIYIHTYTYIYIYIHTYIYTQTSEDRFYTRPPPRGACAQKLLSNSSTMALSKSFPGGGGV